MSLSELNAISRTTRIFFAAFVFSCFLFWWLPSILFRTFGQEDPVHAWAFWMAVLGLGTFALGYWISFSRVRGFLGPLAPPKIVVSPRTMDACEPLAYQATVLLAFVAVPISLIFFFQTMGVQYGEENIPFAYQVVLYLHLFMGLLFLSLAETIPQNKRRIVLASVLIILPRFIVSLHLRRFFLAQAVVPILFIALARGWLRLSGRRTILLAGLALFIVFVPALTRGDNFIGQASSLAAEFESGGVAPILLQDFAHTNLSGRCPPLLVGLTQQTIPYRLLGICMTTSASGMVPASTGGILGENDPQGTTGGAGGNYLLDLYLTGGVTAIAFGSVVFGFSCSCFLRWLGARSAFAGIWAECLTRALYAPRADLGYVYERIPSLIVATLIALWLAWLVHARREGSFVRIKIA